MCGWRRDDMISISRRMCTMSCSSLIFSFRIDLMATWRPEHNRMHWDKKEKKLEACTFYLFFLELDFMSVALHWQKSAWKVFFVVVVCFQQKKNITRSCHIYGFVLTWHRDESKKEELSLEPLRCVIYSAFLLKWSKIKSALVAENVLTRSAVMLAAL